jgi:hypothetical protein
LIPKITLNTHPALNVAKPWSVDIYANKQKTEHSVTLMVAPMHSYLQITPQVPIALAGGEYRLFVSVNGNKALEVNRVPVTAGINGSSPGPGYENGKKKGEPVFEAKLGGGAPETNNVKDLIDVEKCTIYLHFMRQAAY